MPPLGYSTVVCLQQCHSVSFVLFLLFFHTLLHLLVIDPLQYSPSILCSVILLIFSQLDGYYHWCTLLVSLSSFTCNTCPSHFNYICLILLDTGTYCVFCLIVLFVILSLYVIRQQFSQFSMRLVQGWKN